MAGKITKAQAGYTYGMPHCGMCKFYSEDEATETGACKLVEGKIDEDDWCKLYKAKQAKTLAEGGG